MSDDSSKLTEYRSKAALASKGISGDAPRQLVIRLLKEYRLKGDLLDFGAGTGDLIASCAKLNCFHSITGIDILTRPVALTDNIAWRQCDLNTDFELSQSFDAIVCCEVVEHLENPRAVFRKLFSLLKPGGAVIVTTPNQESLRSYLTLVMKGHHASFLEYSYPMHITALLRMDLKRICEEVGYSPPTFFYTDEGCVPKLTQWTWQKTFCSGWKGRWFSDNIGMITFKQGE